jgi:hypothetical protein
MATGIVYEPVQFQDTDELPHPIGDDPAWQESVFLQWFDVRAGVGGTHRVGHEPNHLGGTAVINFGVFSPTQRFRRNFVVPLEDAGDGLGAAGHSYRYEGQPHYRVTERDCELDITVEDFYPRTDFFPRGDSLTTEFAPHHFEASGRITGTLRLGDEIHEIDALGHRDHSWGIRRWDTLLSHRWICGTFGPDLSFGSIIWHARDGSLTKGAYVVRDGEVIYATEIDVITWQDVDGLTHRGGEAIWQLPGGDQLHLECRGVDGTLSDQHDVAWIDLLCTVEHEGRTGACDFEISTNPRQGTGPIMLSLNADTADGLTEKPTP